MDQHGLGRAYKTILPDGSSTEVGFDAFGNTVSEKDTAGHTKLMAYDGNGRLMAVTLPAVSDPLDSDGDGNSGLDAPRFDYAYDWAGNQTLLQDSLGRRTTFTFNAAGQQVARTLPEGNVESFSYNDLGQQVNHTSFEGIVTENVYDNGATNLASNDPAYHVGSGRLTEQRFLDPVFNASVPKEVWRYTYDAFGRKLSVEQLTRSSLNDPLVSKRVESWKYDAAGRLIQAATPEGTINYAYDAVTGQKTRMWTTKAAGIDAANLADAVDDTRYEYNALGWLTKITVVEKNDVPQNDANHATPVTSDDPEVTTYGYDLQGRQVRMDMPNGVVQTTEVNSLGAITRMRQYAPDKTPWDLGDNPKLADYKYTMEGGQRTQMVETFWFDDDNNPQTTSVPRTTTYNWTYDADSRLTSETIDSFDNAVDRTDTFVMDLFGNRLRRTTDLASTPGVVDEAIAYLFDDNDRLLLESVDEGNDGSIDKTTTTTWNSTQQASKTVSENGTVTSSQLFSYDLQGRLASVETTSASAPKARVDYHYDSTGIRISASEFADASGDGTIAPGELVSTTEYLIDHSNFTGYAQTIAETTKNAAGQVTKRIVYTFGTDEITQTVRIIDPTSQLTTQSSTLTFGHDAHGSVRMLFEAAATIAQVFTYSAYGELTAIHNAAGSNLTTQVSPLTSVLYNGESFDSRIGQLYLRARFYDMHRFTTLDPYSGNARDPLSFNKYGFVHANPVMGIDPSE